MAMVKADLVTQLKAFMAGDKSRDDAATDLADIIDAYVRTAEVNVTEISVSGTIALLSGATTGTCAATGTGSGGLL